jgi:hypothetical protein
MMLSIGLVCLLAAALSAALILRAPDPQPRLVISLLLAAAGIAMLARWNGFRGRTYFECRLCGRRWARRYEA